MQKNVMHVQSCVLLIRPVVFLTFSLPSASLDLKVPNIKMKRLGFTSDEVARGVQSHAQRTEWQESERFRGTQRRFPPTYIENTFQAILSRIKCS